MFVCQDKLKLLFVIFFYRGFSGILEPDCQIFSLNKKKGESHMPAIKIKGMSCGHCVASVTKALSNIAGIREVEVSLDKGEASYNESYPVEKNDIRKAIEEIGYEVE
jgi:copper chaperone